MNNFYNFFKFTIPTTLYIVTLDSYKRQISSHNKELNTLATKRDELIGKVIGDIKESDVSSMFSEFINNYYYFLEHLTSDQLVALCNIIGYYINPKSRSLYKSKRIIIIRLSTNSSYIEKALYSIYISYFIISKLYKERDIYL